MPWPGSNIEATTPQLSRMKKECPGPLAASPLLMGEHTELPAHSAGLHLPTCYRTPKRNGSLSRKLREVLTRLPGAYPTQVLRPCKGSKLWDRKAYLLDRGYISDEGLIVNQWQQLLQLAQISQETFPDSLG